MRTLAPDGATDKRIRELQPGQRIKHGRGLYVQRQAGNAISWVLMGRIKGASSSTITVTLGQWPELDIDTAVLRASEARRQMAEGLDPRDSQRAAVALNNSTNDVGNVTFGEYCEKVWVRSSPATKRQRADKTLRDYRTTVNRHIPHLLKLSIRQLSASHVEEAYFKIRQQYPPTAKKLHRILTAVVAAAKAEIASDGRPYILPDVHPLYGIKDESHVNRQRDAYLTVQELQTGLNGSLVAAYRSNNYGLWCQVIALQMLALTGLRVSEVLSIDVRSIYRIGSVYKGDEVRTPFLSVVLKKKKTVRPYSHFIPLTPLIDSLLTTQEVLRRMFLRERARQRDDDNWLNNEFLFPGLVRPGTSLTTVADAQWYWTAAIEDGSNGYDYLKEPDVVPEGSFSPHWLRHTFVTHASRVGFGHYEIEDAQGKAPPSRLSSTLHYLHTDGETVAHRLTKIFTGMGVLYGNYSVPADYRDAASTPDVHDKERQQASLNQSVQLAIKYAPDMGGRLPRNATEEEEMREIFLYYYDDPADNEFFSAAVHLEDHFDQGAYSLIARILNPFHGPDFFWPDEEIEWGSSMAVAKPYGKRHRIDWRAS